ncbi:hypothetical protein OUZ56_029115 [Daphnia magna]|uniref:Uncharacterized protein n=1 Tax=Daphnia magna TaxID=35525 RepID=A0ABR0B5W1_9CRUS|nr:hypothetical protein OUZ56_029115 [Daphnia magna]
MVISLIVTKVLFDFIFDFVSVGLVTLRFDRRQKEEKETVGRFVEEEQGQHHFRLDWISSKQIRINFIFFNCYFDRHDHHIYHVDHIDHDAIDHDPNDDHTNDDDTNDDDNYIYDDDHNDYDNNYNNNDANDVCESSDKYHGRL